MMKKIRKLLMCLGLVLGLASPMQSLSVKAAGYPNWSGSYYNYENPLPKGQCTWYVWGRVKEVLGITLSGTTNDWQTNGQVSNTPTTGSIAMITNSSGWMLHVAYIENVTGNTLKYSEANNTALGDPYNYRYYSATKTINQYKNDAIAYTTGASKIYFIQLTVPKPKPPRPDISKVVPTYTIDQSTGLSTIKWSTVPYGDAYRVHVYDTRKETKHHVSQNLYTSTYQYQFPNKGIFNIRVNTANPSGGSFTDYYSIYYTGNKENIGDNRYVRLKNRGAGKYVFYDAYHGMVTMKALDDENDMRFMFKMIRQNDGSYMIQSVYNPLRYMDIKNNANNNGTWVVLNTLSEAINPKFNIYSSSFGGYAIAKNDGKTVFDGASQYNNLYTWEYVSTNNQYQYFEFEDIKPLSVNSINAKPTEASTVKLSWSQSKDAEGYIIYKKMGNGNYEYLGKTHNLSYVDKSPSFKEYNYYKVYPYITLNDEIVMGDCSIYAFTKVKLKSVSNLNVIPYGKNKTKLTWDSIKDADGYLIYAQKDGKYGYVGMTTKSASYLDTKALDENYNFYWIFPFVYDKNHKMIIGNAGDYKYAKGIIPKVLNLKASSVTGGVKLTWKKQSDAKGYLIYGIRADGNYGYVGMTNSNSFNDKKASKKAYNYYWIYPYHKNMRGEMIIGETPQYVYGRAK